MDKHTAETIVKVYAVLFWISALFALIGALSIMGLSGLGGLGMMGGRGMMGAGLFAGIGILFGLILLGVAVLEVIAGLGLWQYKPWARTVALVVSIISLFGFPIGTIIGAIGIWLFGFEPTVKSLFK